MNSTHLVVLRPPENPEQIDRLFVSPHRKPHPLFTTSYQFCFHRTVYTHGFCVRLAYTYNVERIDFFPTLLKVCFVICVCVSESFVYVSMEFDVCEIARRRTKLPYLSTRITQSNQCEITNNSSDDHDNGGGNDLQIKHTGTLNSELWCLCTTWWKEIC